MLEKQVSGHFKRIWPYHYERQEPGIGAGQPDGLMQDADGRPGLIELKRPDKVVLRTSQWIWHETWQRGKGKAALATCYNERNKIRWHVWHIKASKRVIAKAGNALDAYEAVQCIADMLDLNVQPWREKLAPERRPDRYWQSLHWGV